MAAVYVGVVMAPVLTQIASDFNITTGTAGLVVAAYGAPGIVVAVLTGPYSDRFGRKRFLVIGSHGWGAVKRAVFGSVSTGVLHHAACPVLVVRGRFVPAERRGRC